jgi:uncharacterized membrane protein
MNIDGIEPRKEEPRPCDTFEWAKSFKNMAAIILSILGLFLIIPFIIEYDNPDFIERWSFMLLSPIMTIIGIIIGYYYRSYNDKFN